MASRLPPNELEARLRAFYDAHNPGNQQNIAEIVRKYHGKEAALCAKLQKKYGVAPDLFPPTTDTSKPMTPPTANAPTISTPARPNAVANKPAAYDPEYKPILAPRVKPAGDAALDFSEATFDALKALRARMLAPPVTGIAPLDNIHKCRHLLPETDPNHQKLPTLTAKKLPAKGKPSTATGATGAKTPTAAAPVPLLFEALADTYLDGPFTVLRRCFLERRRVCVVVRRVNSVRGTLRGFLKAFDKHMNLVLLDVQQQWIAPAQYAIHDSARRHARDGTAAGHGEGDGAPLLSVADERRNRSFTTSSYAKQLFVRGDNVVMVLLDNGNASGIKMERSSQPRDYTPAARRR